MGSGAVTSHTAIVSHKQVVIIVSLSTLNLPSSDAWDVPRISDVTRQCRHTYDANSAATLFALTEAHCSWRISADACDGHLLLSWQLRGHAHQTTVPPIAGGSYCLIPGTAHCAVHHSTMQQSACANGSLHRRRNPQG